MKMEHQAAIDTKMAVMATKLDYIKKAIDDVKASIESEYVTKAEFNPVRNVVYTTVALILTAVITALIALVIKNPV